MPPTRPQIEGAQAAACWFDRRRRQGQGSWVTTVMQNDIVETVEHKTQRAGCEYIGLDGLGSPDPDHRPPAGSTGSIRRR